ncbi:LysR substrate-binding domain-containing protein [Leifsonia aquatica]|uniref:LysR substrate-binding domain-containing protein n=1 Tax=Leifsonia aquatica TaxID=144185 RepID=UPI0028A7A7FA|nr:LysR substrate-binding domain-containing protein [Leifsonia aquatica]
MPPRRIPSTSTLTAFEAAARNGSFSLAAQELVVTEGAISRQVARLEAFLHVPLFHRRGNRVELTGHGGRYAEDVGRLLAALEQSTLQVMTTPTQPRVLELAAVGTFATRWLIPRLPSFSREYPDAAVNIATRNEPFVLSGSGFEAAIAFADPAWSGADVRPLFRSPLIPVGSPALIPASLRAEAGVPPGAALLHKTTTPESWPAYAREHGMSLELARTGSRFEQFSMLIEAAMAGLGVALVPALYVTEPLQDGRLVPFGPPGERTGKDFVLVAGPANRMTDLLDAFTAWLLREAAASMAGTVQAASVSR